MESKNLEDICGPEYIEQMDAVLDQSRNARMLSAPGPVLHVTNKLLADIAASLRVLVKLYNERE